ncbi:SusC/RagA family TonB-linked outer membrane protein [Chryseosolibacter indicus]|uniref:SusC/RagA family TonB-linked outer membrane protein n=1 Tax=Chryseosolibacter indicus TaxID=2782351 RepID=A0ABS5VSU7_9BACT|nr:SusC/RagA family TonB-linked outer membrane protein [Chryseosolibacter indicus]MBT1704261.1 SusC/RagA family TonB-linked outer membrane protein [Chryseosolibacter indicus]
MRKLLLTMLSLVIALAAWAQDRTVTGTITSAEDGSSLPGVNVILKGTTTGTTSDADGKYAIKVPSEGGTLVYSFIGLATSEAVIGDRSIVDVTLASDITQLSEVVVTAMGIESQKRSLGTSVSQITSDKIADTRQTNVVNSLSGKVAGVRIQGSSGMVGASSSIFIRGFTSFTQSNQPLFVVDGIPIDNGGGANALQTGVANSNRAIDLNPDDIESMSILKGPAAAVLYGSRAVSGAIIITTKKGKNGQKSSISFTSNYNVVEVNRLPKYQNKYAQGLNGVFDPSSLDSWGPEIEGQTVKNYLGQDEILKAYPDNVKDIFKTGSNFQNSISFSGGNDKSNFIVSYSNLKENGVIKNNELTRNTFKVTAKTQLTSKFNVEGSASYFNTRSNRTPNGNQQSNPLFRGYILPRSYDLDNYPYELPNGSQSYFDATNDNPYWTIANNTYEDRVDRIIGYINLGYDFTDWLNLNYRIGTDAYLENVKAIDAVGGKGNGYTSPAQTGGTRDGNNFVQQTSSYLNLTANKQFGDFSTSFLLGNEINQSYLRNQYVNAVGASVDGFGQVTSYTTYTPFNDEDTRRLVGVYAQATVGYKNFAFVTVNGRNDWSSTFRKGNNSYFYPSINGSFIFTDAFPVMKENNFFNFGKLRASAVKVGREATLYSTDTYFGKSNPSNGFGPQIIFPFRGQQGYSLSNTSGNPDLGPEFTTSTEVGVELGFYQNRITTDFAYFQTHSTDIILDAPTSPASGFTTQTRNAGELKTHGYELTIGVIPVKTANFTWEINANWTKVINNVVAIDPLVNSIFLGGFTTPQTQLQAGQRYGVIVGNKFNRDANGNLLITSTGAGAGQPTANTSKVEVVGDPNPDWTGGITNTFGYKGLSLSFLVDIRKGGDIISRNIRDLRFRGVAEETGNRDRTYIIEGVLRDPVDNPDGTPRALLDGEGKPVPNSIALNAQQYWTSIYNTQGESMVFDASWVRLREVSLSYSLPKTLIGKTPFSSAQLVLTGRNLFLYAPNYPHLDPEINSQGVSNSQGIDFNTLPQTRSYGVLLRVTL